MNVAVVGVGKMGMLHAGIMNGFDDVNLCGMCDASKFLLGFAKNLTQVNAYTDYRKMLDKEKPDALLITTPVFLHIPMALECVERGLPFFLEKPLSLKGEESEELVQRIDERNLVTMVGYMMRYSETFARAKQVIDSGALGEIITFSSTIYVAQLFKTGKGWRYSKEKSGGGVVMGQATHLIDLLGWYFGRVNYVSGHTRAYYSEEVEDFAHVHFEFENGTTGWMDSTWSKRHHRLLEISIEINAKNGNLTVNDDELKFFLDSPAGGYDDGWTIINKPDLFAGVEFDIGGPHFSRQDRAFVDAVKSNRQVESNVKNAQAVQKIVDAIYHSAEHHGEPIKI